MRTAEDLAEEVEYLRNETRELGQKLAKAKYDIDELTRERTKLMTWIDALIYQLGRH